MQIGIAEFLEKVGKLKKTQEKIDAIAANDSLVLRIILQAAYDPKVEWALPEGVPPYKPNDLFDQEHVLIKDCEKLRYFIKGFHDNLNQLKRETMFVEFLERIAPKDAEMIVHIKDKKPIKGVTLQHVTEGLPGLINE
ncbi:hypothetical protein UFOVP787_199 [uncultured Caudovirales phage]|uniref:Uncharacterized protein n=1 Tax=uncultured Caudovirales phage TaxID=2100421 RepID=A0A6J5NZ72_9CAUD|nr:hypothetical protein UFOVP787_199 [uncultured Caudovirales phage]